MDTRLCTQSGFLLHKLFAFAIFALFAALAGCTQQSLKDYAIVSAKMNEREGHGKDFEFELNLPLPKDTYYFKIKFKTKEGDEIEEQGILTSRIHGFDKGPHYRLNVFLYFDLRHSPSGRREIVEKHLNPGHIEMVSIKLASDCNSRGFDEKCQFAEKQFNNL